MSNRELATVFWLGVLGVLMASRRDFRASLRALVIAAVSPRMLIPAVLLGTYCGLLIVPFATVGLWNVGLMKDTLFWFVAVGLGLLLSSTRAGEDPHFFRRALTRTLRLSALVEFYINLEVFSLPVELPLQALVAFLALISATAARKPEFKPSKRIADAALALIGLSALVASSLQLASDWAGLDKAQLLLALALPLWLTAIALPFIYLFSLAAGYEVAFLRIDIFGRDHKPPRRVKLALLVGLHLRNGAVYRFMGTWPLRLAQARTFAEGHAIVDEYLRESRSSQVSEAMQERPVLP